MRRRLAMALMCGCVGLVSAGTAVLVPEDEPGTPLFVSGVIYAADGKSPAAGLRLHVYNTDAKGYYSPEGRNEREPRLRADLTTDAQGRYEFRTIRPGSYPGREAPAHIHYVVTDATGRERRYELHFQDDPLLSEADKQRAAAHGRFGAIRPLERAADGSLRCTFDIALEN